MGILGLSQMLTVGNNQLLVPKSPVLHLFAQKVGDDLHFERSLQRLVPPHTVRALPTLGSWTKLNCCAGHGSFLQDVNAFVHPIVGYYRQSLSLSVMWAQLVECQLQARSVPEIQVHLPCVQWTGHLHVNPILTSFFSPWVQFLF